MSKRWREAKAVIEPEAVEEPTISEEDLNQPPKTFNPKLEVHLEPSNFLSKYIEYAKTTSDAYEEYHFASGLVLLSVAADRQIVVSMRHGDIYPNIWMFPIGDSTISRKTTAFKLCQLILKTKFFKKSLPSSFSPEALMEAISETPRCFYLKDEAGSLLASMCKEYMQETRESPPESDLEEQLRAAGFTKLANMEKKLKRLLSSEGIDAIDRKYSRL